ncbi:CGNR zinc finger domain-containing protein [Saccharopolyspora sp. K220]|uniref:CGNR zinc finger domain-containing protein n=1 Tax=Saccharopolyspora soli TaxID=2926618 RepID=UPI00241307F8|nr:CGNR zinc finger domain-containing protein [Saccharopolyspora soli]MCI2422987.1 CGNR zinc finger domain-containing protein [Saccharopolyspora soli]
MKIPFIDYSIGTGVATDLVNTAPEVRSAGEVLVAPAALARFLVEHDIHPDALANGRQPTDDDLDQVLALRGEIRDIIETTSEDSVAEGAARLVARAGIGPVLQRDAEDRWQWYVATTSDVSLAEELAVLVGTGLLGALRTLGHDRFRACASPVCNGVFVDTSRAGRRRYCMPDLCGNRVNVANHRARHRASGTERSMS